MVREGCVDDTMMPFLYFPEDKAEYIPAVISLTVFMILAVVAMYLFYRKSKKDEKKFNETYGKKMDVEKEPTDRNGI